MSGDVLVVPTGTANMASVVAAFRRLGVNLRQVEDTAEIRDADQLVVPGVGTFGAAMARIDEQGWREALAGRVEAGEPTLAVCVGMQLLAEKSDESTGAAGIGAVRGTIARFPDDVSVPQFGWNQVTPDPGCRFLKPGWAYFANSYRLTSVSDNWARAETDHGGAFVSAMERGNVLACQFHPELSGKWGSDLLGRWIEGTRSAI